MLGIVVAAVRRTRPDIRQNTPHERIDYRFEDRKKVGDIGAIR